MLILLGPTLLFSIVFMLALLHFTDHVIANSQSPMYPFKKKRPRHRPPAGRGQPPAPL